MSISVPTSVDGGRVTSTTLSWSHTVATGSGLVVTVWSYALGANPTVTYDGVSVPVRKNLTYDGDANYRLSLYYLATPNVGTLTVLVTAGSSVEMAAHSFSYPGIDTTRVFLSGDGGTASAAPGGANPFNTVIGTAAGQWVFSSTVGGHSLPTASTNVTSRVGSNLMQSGDDAGANASNGLGVTTTDASGEANMRVWLKLFPAADAQVAVPISDISAGSWTASTGTDLFATIDETVANDADYDQSGTSPSNDTMEVALTSLSTPSTGDVTITVRHRIH